MRSRVIAWMAIHERVLCIESHALRLLAKEGEFPEPKRAVVRRDQGCLLVLSHSLRCLYQYSLFLQVVLRRAEVDRHLEP